MFIIIKINIFLFFYAINSLFQYSHRVGHVILTRVAPQNAQNGTVGSRLRLPKTPFPLFPVQAVISTENICIDTYKLNDSKV